MASNDNAVIYYESGQNAQALEAMTSTDQKTYFASFKPFSARSGFETIIAPAGVINGGALTPAATANTVTVADMLVSLAQAAGADAEGKLTVLGNDVTCARPATDTHLIYSITVNAGGELVAVPGIEGSAFSESRGVAGSAPFVAVDSIEVGQVRYASALSGLVTTTDIKQVPGLHVELSDFPVYSVSEVNGTLTFASALPPIHTGNTAKKIYISGFTPIFAQVPDGYDWTPSEETHSLNSQQVYGRAIGSTSASLNQASFSAVLKDGITDNIMKAVNEEVWVKFKQDLNRAPYQLTQGKLSIARTFPANGQVGATFTLSSREKTQDYAS